MTYFITIFSSFILLLGTSFSSAHNLEKEYEEIKEIFTDTIPVEKDIIFSDIDTDDDEEIFIIVEDNPRFPGCEDMEGSKEEKEACSTRKMLEHIYGNLKYPDKAKENGIEGTVIIQFVIKKDGSLDNINLVRDLMGGCGEASLKVVESMNDLPEKWTPGRQRGVPVNVKYTLPIKFKLEDDSSDELEVEIEEENLSDVKKKIRNPLDKDEEVFLFAEQNPRFPGCEDMEGSKKEKEACSSKKMLEYIYGNLKYPSEARENGIEGTIIVQFVVAKDGSLYDITLARDLDGGCGEAAMDVVESMNNMSEKWIPGTQQGRDVAVKYTLPVRFKLEDSGIKKRN